MYNKSIAILLASSCYHQCLILICYHLFMLVLLILILIIIIIISALQFEYVSTFKRIVYILLDRGTTWRSQLMHKHFLPGVSPICKFSTCALGVRVAQREVKLIRLVCLIMLSRKPWWSCQATARHLLTCISRGNKIHGDQ